MNRRHLLVLAAAALVAGLPAHADMGEEIVAQLRAQGYDTVSVNRTLLGRLRILAENDRFRREIIVNPNTGEILRDLLLTLTGTVVPQIRDQEDMVDDDDPDGDDDGPDDDDGDDDDDDDDDGGGDDGDDSSDDG